MNLGFQVAFKVKHHAVSSRSLGKLTRDLNLTFIACLLRKHHCKHWFLTVVRSQPMFASPPSHLFDKDDFDWLIDWLIDWLNDWLIDFVPQNYSPIQSYVSRRTQLHGGGNATCNQHACKLWSSEAKLEMGGSTHEERHQGSWRRSSSLHGKVSFREFVPRTCSSK